MREIKTTRTKIKLDACQVDDPLGWLRGLQHDALLLAHAHDGVIWGRYVDGQFRIARDAFEGQSITSELRQMQIDPMRFCPPLHEATLQSARLFWSGGEWHVWRTGTGGFRRRIITDEDGDDYRAYFDEEQVLWGSRQIAHDVNEEFTLLEEGSQGLYHAVPIATTLKEGEAVTLCVRNYLHEDEVTGYTSVCVSRLVRVSGPS